MEKETTTVDAVGTRRAHGGPQGAERWKWGAAGGGAVILLALGGYFLFSPPSASTDDAAIEAHVVPVSAKVEGHVERVLVSDNQRVEAGALLFELDSRDLKNRLAKARAKVASDRAGAAKADGDLKRAKALFEKDEASKQDLEHAQAAADGARADAAQSEAALAQAELDLTYARVIAPVAGRVTRKSVETGAYVSIGQSMMALVPDEVWVVANFKETQLARMHPGQSAEIKVDAFPGRRLHGHVDSIQAGTGARFSLLPAENATGNFVKVVQRVPVKIVFDETPGEGRALSPGMSVEATVSLR
ncbi:MAG: HlyD family secretion protein [Elusimicrobia bacterium]|nr:HlyD family secretion protein [Elusimicrobiota bacterium]